MLWTEKSVCIYAFLLYLAYLVRSFSFPKSPCPAAMIQSCLLRQAQPKAFESKRIHEGGRPPTQNVSHD